MEKLLSLIAGIVAAVVALGLPIGYFTINYQADHAEVRTEMEMTATAIGAVVIANPLTWRSEVHEFNELLSRRPWDQEAEARIFTDTGGQTVADRSDALSSPVVHQSVDIAIPAAKIGTLLIARSLRPLLQQTAIVAFFAILIGAAAFASLRILPIRALRRAADLLDREQGRRRQVEAALSAAALKEMADQRAAAKERSRQQATLRSLIDSLPDLVSYKDPEGRYLGCNDAFARMMGKSKAQIIGHTDIELHGGDRGRMVRERDVEMLRTLKPLHLEEWLRFADGRTVWAELHEDAVL